MKKLVIILVIKLLCLYPSYSQDIVQTLKGVVTDLETRKPLTGAYITEISTLPANVTVTDSLGKFRLLTSLGRVSVKISYLGYEDQIIRDILVISGKETELNVTLQEKVIRTSEVIISSDRSGRTSINQMATISTRTIRTDDALRYAGGFYDPSRIVNAFAGIITSNSDYSNDIVIRGNSSRGLLWRLEGIEIPNPNHFSDGQGGSGGAFSSITSNVIANFDFFTGAFPAEFGNAFSGVMDLNLRKGNSDKREYAFQTGMIGAEVSTEGPFSRKNESSYLLNARYTNFKFLNKLGLIDLEETNHAPQTKDLAFNIYFPLKKAGNINLFGIFGSSELGKLAIHDVSKWTSLEDRWEEMEKQSSGSAGIKYIYVLPDSKTYLRTVFAYTSFSNSYSEGYIDSSFIRTEEYCNSYKYPSFRSSLVVNHKFNSANTIRGGLNYNYLTGTMSDLRRNSAGHYDTLVAPTAEGTLLQYYAQWKYRPAQILEINTGVHLLEFTLNHQFSIEPRLGIRCQVAPGNSIIAGMGFHSRIESLAVYNTLIKNPEGIRTTLNREMELSKAFHMVAGAEFSLSDNIRFCLEGYYQHLFNIPIVNKTTSQYSTINSAERLPDSALENAGTGRNTGIELTIEKSFSRNYYFLVTASFFDSWYKSGDHCRYNTYYNTKYVSNILIGKDFHIGKNGTNTLGMNVKYVIRGGYRYTPVDETKSLKAKKIVYDVTKTYSNQLPDFMRLDAGINFRRNHPRYSWVIMLDVMNVSNRKNVFRKRFSFENGKIVTRELVSLGIIPVFNFRLEF
jgi:hypothetical protein